MTDRLTSAILLSIGLLTTMHAADWPCWHGPSHNGHAPEDAPAIIQDLSRAKRLWSSEDVPPPSAETVRLQERKRVMQWHSGFASPVVAQGRVFCFFKSPRTDAEAPMDESLLTDLELAEQVRDPARQRAYAALLADGVLLCLDAANGETLWRQTLPGNSMNNNWKGKGAACTTQTACVADGRVFVFDSMGVLRAFDAATGEVLWHSPYPGIAERQRSAKEKALATGRVQEEASYGACPAPMVIGHLVIAGDGSRGHRATFCAFSVTTGERIWGPVEPVSQEFAVSPKPWTSPAGDGYVLLGTRLVEAATGRICWSTPKAHFGNAVMIYGDLMAVNDRGKAFHLYRIAPDGYTLVQTTEAIQEMNQFGVLLQIDGILCLTEGGKPGKGYAVDLKAGRLLWTDMPGRSQRLALCDYAPIAVGKQVINTALRSFVLTEDRFQAVGDRLPVHQAADTSPAFADGILFVRTQNDDRTAGAIEAWDLRR